MNNIINPVGESPPDSPTEVWSKKILVTPLAFKKNLLSNILEVNFEVGPLKPEEDFFF